MPLRTTLTRLRRRTATLRNQQRIARINQQVAEIEKQSSGIRQSGNQEVADQPIVFFTATTRLAGFTLNAAFALLTSWSLRLSGSPVIHFVCQAGMIHCVLGTNSADLTQPPPCNACIAQSQRLYRSACVAWASYQEDSDIAKALTDLTVEQLGKFEFQISAIERSGNQGATAGSHPLAEIKIPIGRLVLPSVRWALRRHHLMDDEPTRRLMREYILSAHSIAVQFADLLSETRPAAAVFFNGILYPEAAARWVARQMGVRSLAYEVGFQPYSVFFTDGEPTAYPVHIPEDFELTPIQNARLDAQLEQRFQGKFTMAGIQFWPEMRGLDQTFLDKAAGFRQIVPIFTNVVYDSSQIHANTLFSNMFDWLDLMLKIIRRHPETLFVIRAHPDEKRPISNKISNESVHDWVFKNEVNRLSNVVFIEPDEFISSYELIQRSKFVMVYNSSIGLEATLLGAPVICGGAARYTQQSDTNPIVYLPESVQALEQLAETFLSTDGPTSERSVPSGRSVPANLQTVSARRFLYYQFFRISLPMDQFLKAGEKQGSVYLKTFSWQQLLPKNSLTLQIIQDGILHQKPFILPEDNG